MKRPLVYGLGFLIVGLLAGQFVLHWDGVVHFAFFFVLVCMCGGLAWRYKWAQVFLFLLFFSLGFARSTQVFAPVDARVETIVMAGRSVEVEGIVLEVSRTKSGYLRTVIQATSVQAKEETIETRLKIQAYMREEQEVNISQKIKIRCTLEKPERKRNLGAFDEFQYLKSQNIEYKTFATLVHKGESDNRFLVRLYQLKNKILSVYDEALPEREARIMKSMILGDTSELDEDIKELYTVSGIYHILAISGQHITVLALVLNLLLLKQFGKRMSGLLVMSFLILYALMSGCAVSTVRAVVMFGVYMVGQILDRDTDLMTSTAFAAIGLLLFQPLNLFNMGFQFSFAAVFAIAVGTEPIKRFCVFVSYRSRVLGYIFKNRYMLEYFPASAAAFLATLPISVYHFYYLTPYGLLVNLLIVATTSFLIIAGFLVGVIGLISTSAAVFVCGSVYYLLHAYDWICTFFVALPFSKYLVGTPSLVYIVFWYGLYACFVFLFSSVGDTFQKRKPVLYAYVLLFLGVPLVLEVLPKQVEITILDMGQADCFVITQRKKCFVIDSGIYGNDTIKRNRGSQVLSQFLLAKGIKKVDAAVIRADLQREVLDYAVFDLVKKKAVKALYIENVFEVAKGNELADMYTLMKRYQTKFGVVVDSLETGDILEWNQVDFEYGELNTQSIIRQRVKNMDVFYLLDTVQVYRENKEIAVIHSGEGTAGTRETTQFFSTAKQGAVRLKETRQGVAIDYIYDRGPMRE